MPVLLGGAQRAPYWQGQCQLCLYICLFIYTVDSGYQAHALVGTIAKIYDEVHYITRVKG